MFRFYYYTSCTSICCCALVCWLVLCYLIFIYFFISVAVDPSSWELIYCGTNSNGSRLCFDTYFIPPVSFWELSVPPLRFVSSCFVVFISNGFTSSICPFFSSSSYVSGSWVKTRGSYWNNGMTFSIWNISCL